jgi:hypothetical protein
MTDSIIQAKITIRPPCFINNQNSDTFVLLFVEMNKKWQKLTYNFLNQPQKSLSDCL